MGSNFYTKNEILQNVEMSETEYLNSYYKNPTIGAS